MSVADVAPGVPDLALNEQVPPVVRTQDVSSENSRKLKVNTSDPADPDQTESKKSTPKKKMATSSTSAPPPVTPQQDKSAVGSETAEKTTPPPISVPQHLSRAAPLPGADHYAVLNVSHSASISDIRRAYKQAAVQWHPDKNIGKEVHVAGVFERVKEAFEVLGDQMQRSAYDALLASKGSSAMQEPATVAAAAAASSGSSAPASVACEGRSISARVEGKCTWLGKRSQQIKGPKKQPQGLQLFFESAGTLQLVATFGMKNNVRFKPHEVTGVRKGAENTTISITSGLMHIELVVSEVDAAELDELVKVFPNVSNQ